MGKADDTGEFEDECNAWIENSLPTLAQFVASNLIFWKPSLSVACRDMLWPPGCGDPNCPEPEPTTAWNKVGALKSSLTDDEDDCANCEEMWSDFQFFLASSVPDDGCGVWFERVSPNSSYQLF